MSFLDDIRKQHGALTRTKAAAPAAPQFRSDRMPTSYAGSEAAEIADGFIGYAGLYRCYTWARRAIDVTANNVVSLPVRVVDADGEAQEQHPLSLLLSRGNDQMTMPQVWSHWLTSMYLGGEGPLEIIDDKRGNPLWLWPRRPDMVFVLPDMAPERANYPTVAGYTVLPDQPRSAPMDVPSGNMVFDKFHNPLNPWRGLAPIAALRTSIVIDLFAQAWAKMFLARGARPDYALIAPQGIAPSEKAKMEAELMFKFGGPDNWHKPIILEDGVTDIKPFSFAPADMEWLEQRQFTQNEVGAVFGVPDEIMGFGKDTYENFQTALEVFWTLTLRPLIDRRDSTLTHFFSTRRPLLEPGLRIATDISSVGVLQEDKAPKVDMALKLWQIGVPFNQLDEQLRLGIGPIPNGEFPNGTDPAEAARMAEMIAGGGNGAPGEDGDGADAEDAPDAQDDDQEARPGDKAARPFGLTHGSITPSTVKALRLLHDPSDDDTPEEQLLQALEGASQREIAAALRITYRDLLPANAEDMDLYQLQAYLDQRITNQALNDAIDATVRRATDAGVAIAADQLATFGGGFDYTMVHTAARDWASQYSAQLITNVNDTTRKAVQNSVARWYENGEHLDALTKDLKPIFGKRRARLIAMTETTHSAAQGTLRGYEASGVVKAMIWMTANDEKVCPYCGSLDGQTVGLQGNFSDALPPDLQAKLSGRTFKTPPAHPGCRCRIGAEVIDLGD
jgi:HK97 family phage portal protein